MVPTTLENQLVRDQFVVSLNDNVVFVKIEMIEFASANGISMTIARPTGNYRQRSLATVGGQGRHGLVFSFVLVAKQFFVSLRWRVRCNVGRSRVSC